MSTLNDYIRLTWSEMVTDHPFTNPDHNAEDLTNLQYMVEKLRQVLSQPDALANQPGPIVLYLQEAGGRRHRIAISNLAGLLADYDVTVVGFCGQKWPEADRTSLEVIDLELVNEFRQHPYLLSYSSLELASGDWRNLVLFSQLQGIGHWSRSTLHTHAASELAPKYYRNIRLHNGILPGGLMAGGGLTLVRTKYFDYQDGTTWWAVRELVEL